MKKKIEWIEEEEDERRILRIMKLYSRVFLNIVLTQ